MVERAGSGIDGLDKGQRNRLARLGVRVGALDLFAPSMLQLVDDAQGGARYWPGVVDPDTAQCWFDSLAADAGWRHMRRPMYDRMVDVPRLLASYPVDELPADLPLAPNQSGFYRVRHGVWTAR